MAKDTKKKVVYNKKYYVATSQPMTDFLEKNYGLCNMSNDNRIKEYTVNDSKSITIKNGQIFLSDKKNAVSTIDSISKNTKISQPVIVYNGLVIGKERIIAFLACTFPKNVNTK